LRKKKQNRRQSTKRKLIGKEGLCRFGETQKERKRIDGKKKICSDERLEKGTEWRLGKQSVSEKVKGRMI